MASVSRILAATALLSLGLTACGGGGESTAREQPLNTDYSTLRVADTHDAPLQYAASDDQILSPLRNGLRLMTQSSPVPSFLADTAGLAGGSGQVPFSATTVQVDGVDEADSVKYDGHYLYSARRQITPGAVAGSPALNVIAIARTDATAATVQPIANFVLEESQSDVPQLYRFPGTGQADSLVAVSNDFSGWAIPLTTPVSDLVVRPDRTTVQLLDVRDPLNVSQAWKLRIDGWLNASRMIGDTLYLVTSYRPRIPNIVFPADTQDKRDANERLIRSASATQLLPHYTENGGPARALVPSHGCLIGQQMANNEGYTDLLVISAINVRSRRIIDVNCLSTNVNGVYVSRNSLYVAGTTAVAGSTLTVLHKFAINDGEMSYRATGSVSGIVGWSNPSYFMDEQNGDLRIVTSEQLVHRLTVLRESGRRLSKIATLPNAARPAAIGKTGEQVFAVRFVGDRGYIVTARFTDPLYVLDLHDPADPAIAGQLEIPGVSNYLRVVGNGYLLGVGQELVNGRRAGVKVELFDVSDIAHPQSLGAQVFGNLGSGSAALSDPHALTFLERPDSSLRLMLPIDVYDTPKPGSTPFGWSYSGFHVLEVAGPQLRYHGLLKTADNSSAPYPPYPLPERGILHDDAVFAVSGEQLYGKRWADFPAP